MDQSATAQPPTRGTETERIRGIYDKQAIQYDRKISFAERLLLTDGRQWVCSQADGLTLEVAVGTGRNFAFYPREARLTGIDLSLAMLGIARQRAETLGLSVDLRVGDAQQLDFPDMFFDTVVLTLALCSIPDDGQAVAEVVRVLRPGGRLLWLEHGYSSTLARIPGLTWLMERTFEPLMVRLEGDHLLRNPVQQVTARGLVIERLERSKLGIAQRGLARKRAMV